MSLDSVTRVFFKSVAPCIFVLLTACASTPSATSWPEGAVEQQAFVRAYHADAANQQVQTEDEYLYWVERFYLGLAMFPGWLDISEQVLDEMDAAGESEVAEQLYELGAVIGAEWAKDNSVHRISNRAVAAWGQAVMEAQSQDDLDNFLERLQNDVDGLLAGNLSSREITPERYYSYDFEPF